MLISDASQLSSKLLTGETIELTKDLYIKLFSSGLIIPINRDSTVNGSIVRLDFGLLYRSIYLSVFWYDRDKQRFYGCIPSINNPLVKGQ